MQHVSRFLWLVSILGALLGGLNFFGTYVMEVMLRNSPDISAPQIASLAGASLAFAAIPYVLARGWDEITRSR